MIKYLLCLLLFSSCASCKWYKVSCSTNFGMAMNKEMLLTYIEDHGYSCDNKKAEINIIKNQKIIQMLESNKRDIRRHFIRRNNILERR